LGDSTNHDNFYYKSIPIDVLLEAEVSQGIKIENLFVERREAWNGEGVMLDKVLSGHLLMTFSNGFPLTFSMNFYMEDEAFTTIDTLFQDEIIIGALPGPDGKVKTPVETNLNLLLTESLKNSINNAKYGRYEITINSVENDHVKIYSDYIMKFKISGDFKLKIEQ